MRIALIISVLIHIGLIAFLNTWSLTPDQQKPPPVQIRVSLRNWGREEVGGGREVRRPQRLLEFKPDQPPPFSRLPDSDLPRPEVTRPFEDRQFVGSLSQPVKPEPRGQKMVPVISVEEAGSPPKLPELRETPEKLDKPDRTIPEPSVKPETWKPEEIHLPLEPKPIPTVKGASPEAKKVVVKTLKPTQKSQKPGPKTTPGPTMPSRPPHSSPEQALAQKVEPKVPSDPIVQTPPQDPKPRILDTTPGKETYPPSEASNVSTSRIDMDSNAPAGQPPAGTRSEEPPPASANSDILADPVPRYNPRPEYPREARKFGWEGTVLLIVEVLPDGNAGKIEIKESSGHSVLDRAAIQAIRKWRFTPAQRQGTPVPATTELPVIFRLKD